MSVRTIKYLVVDDITKDVPDTAPELDATVDAAGDVVTALASAQVVPSGAQVYIQTFRPDGTPRWQEARLVTQLPGDSSLLLAKILFAGKPAAQARPVQPAPAASHHSSKTGMLGKLMGKLGMAASGHSSGGSARPSRPMGAGAAAGAAGGFMRPHRGSSSDDDDQRRQNDFDGDGIPDELDPNPTVPDGAYDGFAADADGDGIPDDEQQQPEEEQQGDVEQQEEYEQQQEEEEQQEEEQQEEDYDNDDGGSSD